MPNNQELIDVATKYWINNETMESIARNMNVSRSTISRILSEAREQGIVQIRVRPPASDTPLVEEFKRKFNVDAHIVRLPQGASSNQRLKYVAQVAGDYLIENLETTDVVGLAWGATLLSLTEELNYHPIPGLTLVQINGAVNTQNTGIPWVGDLLARMGEKLNANVIHFPVPAFFDNPRTKEMMWEERSIKAVLEVQKRMTVALFSVGVLSGPIISHVYAHGYLDDNDQNNLRKQGVVGDVCTVMLREDGSFSDIPINAGATGLNPLQLQNVPTRICVVSGPTKAAPILGALRAGVATDIFIDFDTAKAVLLRSENKYTSL